MLGGAMMDMALAAQAPPPPPKSPGSGPGPGAPLGSLGLLRRRPPGTGGARLLNGGVVRGRGAPGSPGRRSSGRLSAAASLPLLLQDPDEEDGAPSLSNILDAVPGLEVADDDGIDVPPPRRPPTPPPRTTAPLKIAASATYNDLYYCKPWPALEDRPLRRRASPCGEPLPPPPRLPDHFDEREYLQNRQRRRPDLPVRSHSLRTTRPTPPPRRLARPTYILRQEVPVQLCPSRKSASQHAAAGAGASTSPCRMDPACWTPPPPPTADSPLEPLPPIDLAVGGEPVGRVRRFLRAFHRELGGRDPPHAPPWASPLPAGCIAPRRMDPAVCIVDRTDAQQHLDIRLEQILSPVRTSDGGVLEAPRRVLVEAGPAMGKTTLALRVLAAWAEGAPWIPPDVTLAFLIPLREIRGNTLAAYLGKHLLPKSAVPANFDKVWRTILGLEERLLFVLDGYDEAVAGTGREALGDALDLLEGRLMKDARVILTCNSCRAHEVAGLMQRRILLTGLQWAQVESLSRTFFDDDEVSDRFLDALSTSEDTLQPMARAPLGWMALCTLFQDIQDLPEDPLQLHQALFRCLAWRSLARHGHVLPNAETPPRGHALLSSEIPPHSRQVLADLGRLALVSMKDRRCMYSDNDLRVHCGSAAGVASLGFLSRGLNLGRATASRRVVDFYTPVVPTMAEFLAAYYMASVASYANILRRDLQLLSGLAEGAAESVLLFLVGLLGRRGHLVLSQLSPLDATPRSVFPLLRAAGPSEDNVDAACRLLGAANGAGGAGADPAQAAQATVPCRALEVEGWSWLLRAPSCALASLELVVSADGDGRLEPLFSALAANRSVRFVRVSTLLGHELSAHQLQRLAKHLRTVLARPRTQALELVVACLEERAHDRFQCLVDALCAGLHSPSCALNRLLVDINLDCAQLQQLLSCLHGTAVRTLQLPHLGCGSAGLRALAHHLQANHAIDALSLAGSWGARNHGASESGGSVGSSTCFSSLPRGALGLHGSLSRPATLPRQPLGALGLGSAGVGPGGVGGPGGGANDSGYGSADTKRGSDSLLWRGQAAGALPVCDPTSHAGSGFHDVFEAIRDASCPLRNLNVSKSLLSPGDATCLGAAVRSGALTALRLEGAARLWEVLPTLLALAADPPLQLLDASSPRLSLPDGPAHQVFTALAKNTNLRLLSLDGWTFRFEEETTLRGLATVLAHTGVRDLSLAGCRLHCTAPGGVGTVGRGDAELQGMLLQGLQAAMPASLGCTELLFLRLAGLQVWVRDRVALRGPQLLPFLRGLGSLRELDLSAEREDLSGHNTVGPRQPGPLVIDDKTLVSFWASLAECLRCLQTLHVAHWRIKLDDPERTLRAVAKSMRRCPLVSLRADGLIVCDNSRGPLEHLFLQTASANLCCLGRLGMSGVTLSAGHAATLGRHIRDRFPGATLSLQVANVASESVAALTAALQDGGKVDVTCLAGSPPQLRLNRVVGAAKPRRFRTRFTSLCD